MSDWAQGRCYERIRSCKKFSKLERTFVNVFVTLYLYLDIPCEGDHMSQGNCCEGLYCYKPNPSWAEGRCYESESTTTSSKQQLVKTTPTPASCKGYREFSTE